jgi:ribosomal protein L11 methylase PrmA
MDTMSWVKKGAGPVVGIDFSPKAIEAARDLSKELRIETEFVE